MNPLKIVNTLLTTCILYFVILPFRISIRRNSNLIIVIGRDNGKILDNCKYILQGLNESNHKSFYYLTRNADAEKVISDTGIKVHVQKKNLQTFIFLLKAGVIVVDSLDWSKGGWHLLYQGAKIIQLWHGIPLKEIELQKAKRQINEKNRITQISAKLFWKITNRFPKFHALIATSDFSADLLSKCINTKGCWITGYPRNDVLLKRTISNFDYLNTDSIALLEIAKAKSKSYKTILFTPTFRDGFSNPLENNALLLSRIDNLLKKNNIILFIKFHPWVKDIPTENFDNIQIIQSDSDIYPLLRDFDLLITDYSSIYFDFLLTEKPIVFFPHDLADYTKDQRSLLVNYDAFTPGKKAFSLPQLTKLVLAELKNDSGRHKRQELVKLMFKNIDSQATERVVNKILLSAIQ